MAFGSNRCITQLKNELRALESNSERFRMHFNLNAQFSWKFHPTSPDHGLPSDQMERLDFVAGNNIHNQIVHLLLLELLVDKLLLFIQLSADWFNWLTNCVHRSPCQTIDPSESVNQLSWDVVQYSIEVGSKKQVLDKSNVVHSDDFTQHNHHVCQIGNCSSFEVPLVDRFDQSSQSDLCYSSILSSAEKFCLRFCQLVNLMGNAQKCVHSDVRHFFKIDLSLVIMFDMLENDCIHIEQFLMAQSKRMRKLENSNVFHKQQFGDVLGETTIIKNELKHLRNHIDVHSTRWNGEQAKFDQIIHGLNESQATIISRANESEQTIENLHLEAACTRSLIDRLLNICNTSAFRRDKVGLQNLNDVVNWLASFFNQTETIREENEHLQNSLSAECRRANSLRESLSAMQEKLDTTVQQLAHLEQQRSEQTKLDNTLSLLDCERIKSEHIQTEPTNQISLFSTQEATINQLRDELKCLGEEKSRLVEVIKVYEDEVEALKLALQTPSHVRGLDFREEIKNYQTHSSDSSHVSNSLAEDDVESNIRQQLDRNKTRISVLMEQNVQLEEVLITLKQAAPSDEESTCSTKSSKNRSSLNLTQTGSPCSPVEQKQHRKCSNVVKYNEQSMKPPNSPVQLWSGPPVRSCNGPLRTKNHRGFNRHRSWK